MQTVLRCSLVGVSAAEARRRANPLGAMPKTRRHGQIQAMFERSSVSIACRRTFAGSPGA